MVCKVCKRELTSPVCDFCGEDNSAYMELQEKGGDAQPEQYINNLSEEKQGEVKIKKFKIDYKKLFVLIGVLALIIAAIVIVISWLIPSNDKNDTEKGILFSSDMLSVCENGEWGYISSSDPTKFAIEPQFRIASDFMDDVAFVMIGDKYAMINKKGDLLTVPRFDSFAKISDNGYIPVSEDGKWGYIKPNAKYVISPKFSSASRFCGGVAVVSVNGAYGYIGEDGEYTIAPQYDMALDFSDDSGLAAIKADGKWGYINAEGGAVIEPRFEQAFTFEDGHATVKLYGDYGVIDTDGKFLIEPIFDEHFVFEKDGNATVKTGSRYGYIDAEGSFIIAPRYRDMGSFGDQSLTYAARGDGKYGFIDKEGKFVIEPQFEDAGEFSSGIAPVKSDGLWGYIGEDGKYVIDPRFSSASAFYADGYAICEDALGKTVVIDISGNNVLGAEMNLSHAISK